MAVYWNEGLEYAFISYKSDDHSIAVHLQETLSQNGIACWMAPDSIEGGKSYASEIPQAIKNAKAFIIILSSRALTSQWVEKELDTALKYHIKVYPYYIEDISLTESFEFYLTNIQAYNAFASPIATMEKLIRDIRILFDSIDIVENAESIDIDPIIMMETLPHYFDSGYLLMGRYVIQELQNTYMEGVQSYKAIDSVTERQVYITYVDKTVPHSKFSHGFSSCGAFFQHKAIATPLDEYSTEYYFVRVGIYYTVESLDTVLRRTGAQSPLKVLSWAIPVCDALDYMHRKKGFVYGGLNLINIRLKENGQPLLFDVGGAAKIGSVYAKVAPWAWNVYPKSQRIDYLYPSGDLYALAYCMVIALGADLYRDEHKSVYDNVDVFGYLKKIRNRIPRKMYLILYECLSVDVSSAYLIKHELYECYKELKKNGDTKNGKR